METYGFVTFDDVENYLDSYYSKSNNLVCHFRVLDDSQKAGYLMTSIMQIDALVMQGCIEDRTQEHCFPRKGCFKEHTIPEEVKYAQIENALALFNKSLSAKSDQQMKTMASLGLMKNLKGNQSELGSVGFPAIDGGLQSKRKRLESEKAERMLRPWIGG